MCGIAGIVGPLADGPGRAWLEQAVAGLHHRGPDGSGTWHDDGVGLGHARLAILDLSPTGDQPMHTTDGSHVIVYNGEVYGLDELRAPLVDAGYAFRGHSDTEIVLERLARNGLGELEALNGMFGLALWDRRDKALVLARDRVGIKPLYYAEIGDSVAFASELLPLSRLPGVDRRVDPEALSAYMAFGMVPAPFTILRGVRQLMPGTFLRFTDGRMSAPAPFTERVAAVHTDVPADPVEQDRELQRLIEVAVRDQLVADVPVGVLLSGGVDSSVIAAAAARARTRIRTFSVVHDNPVYDEREAARTVARHLGSDHVEVDMPTGGLTQDELHDLVAHHGDPFADSSSLPTRRLAREVRKHVTVALSGDGGDELLAGYDRFYQGWMVEQAARLPRLLRSGVMHGALALTGRLPNGRPRGLLRRGARAFSLTHRPPEERAVGTITYYWPDETARLLAADYRAGDDVVQRVVASHAAAGVGVATVDGAHRLDMRRTLPGDMLTKVDRMTMAESLEIRPPLLDNRIVRFAAGLPLQRKMKGREGKAILKALARRWVPPEVVDRPKQGFGVPLLDYGGAVLSDATAWALDGADSPLQRLFPAASRAALKTEFARRGDGVKAEDSAFRRMHRQWTVTLLALALQKLDATL